MIVNFIFWHSDKAQYKLQKDQEGKDFRDFSSCWSINANRFEQDQVWGCSLSGTTRLFGLWGIRHVDSMLCSGFLEICSVAQSVLKIVSVGLTCSSIPLLSLLRQKSMNLESVCSRLQTSGAVLRFQGQIEHIRLTMSLISRLQKVSLRSQFSISATESASKLSQVKGALGISSIEHRTTMPIQNASCFSGSALNFRLLRHSGAIISWIMQSERKVRPVAIFIYFVARLRNKLSRPIFPSFFALLQSSLAAAQQVQRSLHMSPSPNLYLLSIRPMISLNNVVGRYSQCTCKVPAEPQYYFLTQ